MVTYLNLMILGVRWQVGNCSEEQRQQFAIKTEIMKHRRAPAEKIIKAAIIGISQL